MQDQNPQSQFQPLKQQTIEQYINENLQLKTLKIQKFSFQNSFSKELKSSRKISTPSTLRQAKNISSLKQTQNFILWEPKISHRKMVKDPKLLLSVERRKIKTSQNMRKAQEAFSNPQTRQGFRGQKIRNNSFQIYPSQQKVPNKITIQTTKSVSLKKYKYVPNFPFNLSYIRDQRKKQEKQKSIEERTKIGSNKGYLTFFSSENFSKYLQKNLVNPTCQNVNKASQRKNKIRNKNQNTQQKN